ncbi:M20/M25/M40 family metallo-hydrolase [Peribacillus frigoritolerans]|uniref:M28 family peptidase n=1 Tax=Peribacillus frigoritolerans TaxID=450367 RepID=UPI001EFD285F|nr:M28 family peptidase [Peribacillus frigoritolerans]ULM95071.1 M20/M25/M40 family metallo-hydrolase [Peribacillus frigoritolerans]
MYRKSLTVLLAAGMVLSTGTVFAQTSGAINAQSDTAFDNKVIKKISADNMYNTIAYLSEQPRAAGTEGELRAVKYIESQFKSLGFETKVQPFPIYDTVQNVKVKIGDSDLGGTPRALSGSISGKVTAELVNVGKAKPEEVGENVSGKIALIERGDITFVEKVQNVLNKGAVGVIMYNNSPSGNNFGQVSAGQNIPAIAITQAQGLELVEQLKTKQITSTLEVGKAERIEKTSYNVIASLKPKANKDNGQIVTVGAHHDSVPGGPGANDDASGVSAVLELARILAKTPIDTEIRFLTFGSEERGLVGSSFYADSLPKEDVDRMVAHFQMDMIGGRDAGEDNPAGGLIMYTIDGKKNLVTDLGSSAGARTMDVAIPYGQLGRSDHQPFHELGIPSALFIHSPVEPWYHQPTDTLDKISKEKLQQAAEIVGASVYQIARPETPALTNARVAPGTVDYDFDDRPVD